ncbi:MAG: hypothetical protein M1836_001310 [Candelina mexicana]|nr:MAG: hypothetical protein M1836_001310 [Candelina mexicana]
MASLNLFARVSRPLRGLSPASPITRSARSFQSSSRLLQTATIEAPVKKPVGAFRGGLFGFLLGSTLSGAGVYYYILEEYKVSNELLTEDIYALQAAVQKIHTYVQTLEDKVEKMERRK